MRLPEFLVRVHVHERQTNVAVAVHFGALIALGVLSAALHPLFERLADALVGDVWSHPLSVAPFAVGTVVVLAPLIPALRRIERRHGLRCPKCAKDLHARPGVVIASRHCPHCGGTVIDGD